MRLGDTIWTKQMWDVVFYDLNIFVEDIFLGFREGFYFKKRGGVSTPFHIHTFFVVSKGVFKKHFELF